MNSAQPLVPISTDEIKMLLEAGQLLAYMKRDEEAEKVFTGLSPLIPHMEHPQVALGNLYFARDEMDKAEESFKKALKINPESPFAQTAYAEFLYFSNRKDEGEELINKALRNDPTGPFGDFARSLKQFYEELE